MFRKNYFSFLLAIALFLASGIAVFAQTAPVSGQVVMTKADGTTEPIAGALIEVFRTDQKGKFPSDKTDKKGRFAFAGLPLGAEFVFSISGSNIKPEIRPGIRAGMDKIVINVSEGDGTRWTEDQVREALAAPKTNAQTGNASSTATDAQQNAPKKEELSAEDKKSQEEYEKKKAEVEAKNKKITESTAIVKKSLEEGNKAYDAKNYDLAIAKFEEGYNADPEFAGSAPVLLNNKALALTIRATNNYNQAVKADAATKAAAMESVKKDYQAAADASDRALEILKSATSTDAGVQKGYEEAKFNALRNRKEAYRLMTKTGADRTKSKETLAAFQEYIAAEPDAKKKSDAQLALGQAMQDSQDFDQAVIEFEKVLAADANNADALVGAGLSLVNTAYNADGSINKEKMQKGADYLQKFVSVAPANHPFKDDATALLDSLKKEQNVAPQKNSKKKP